jgi:hypothetical protein
MITSKHYIEDFGYAIIITIGFILYVLSFVLLFAFIGSIHINHSIYEIIDNDVYVINKTYNVGIVIALFMIISLFTFNYHIITFMTGLILLLFYSSDNLINEQRVIINRLT